jgi:sugar phosphate isomerase/epimerase
VDRAVALSTSFVVAQELGPDAALDLAARAGAASLILDSTLDPARYGVFRDELRGGGMSILAVEAPCPWTRASAAELASPDRDESRAATDEIEATIARAAELGARFVVVRCGEVRSVAAEWVPARDRYLRRELDARRARALADMREQAGARAVDTIRRALDRLLRRAEAADVTLLVRNPRRFVDAPSPRELDLIAADLRGAPLAALYDVPAAHLTDDMGLWPLPLVGATFGGRAAIAYLGDACGAVGGLAPGRGVVDLRAVAATLPATCARAFSPWSGLTPDEVAAAITAIAAL